MSAEPDALNLSITPQVDVVGFSSPVQMLADQSQVDPGTQPTAGEWRKNGVGKE